jgi:4-amino-4-deoxy-L-arabinose transferase-like glycosyltransferase
VVLGYGLLVKGPLHLLAPSVPVITVIGYTRRYRSLFSWGHLLGIILVFGVALAWYLPAYLREGQPMLDTMFGQMGGRVSTNKPNYSYWGRNIAMSFINFLPWLLFLPAMWDKRLLSHLPRQERKCFKGARLGLVLAFVIIDAMPNMMPRYSLPTFALASILLGWVLSLHKELFISDRFWRKLVLILFVGCGVLSIAAGVAWITGTIVPTDIAGSITVIILSVSGAVYCVHFRKLINTVSKLAMATAVLVMFFVLNYAIFGMNFIKAKELHRPIGRAVAELTPQQETVYAYKPGFQTFLFYIREPLEYITHTEQIDQDIEYLMIWSDVYELIKNEGVFFGASPEELYHFSGRLDQSFVYLRLNWNDQGSN